MQVWLFLCAVTDGIPILWWGFTPRPLSRVFFANICASTECLPDRQKLNTAYLLNTHTHSCRRYVCEAEDARFNADERKTVRRADRGQLWAPPVAQAKADLQGFKSRHRPLTNTQAWPSQIKRILWKLCVHICFWHSPLRLMGGRLVLALTLCSCGSYISWAGSWWPGLVHPHKARSCCARSAGFGWAASSWVGITRSPPTGSFPSTDWEGTALFW